MDEQLIVCGEPYRIRRLLGHGKGGYSYLAETEGQSVVIKQIHHEPCDYYAFGNKIEAERLDYERLLTAGIRIPRMLAVDPEAERIVKEYIEGPTIFELIKNGASAGPWLVQVREMAAKAKAAGLNIDYFPTNFVVRDGLIWYVDYECNEYMDEWSFENWGIRYWSRTPEFEAYLRDHKPTVTIREERITAEEYIDFLKRTDLGSQYPKERFDERVAQSLRRHLDIVLRFVVGGVAVAPGVVIVPAHVAVVVLRGNVRPGRHHIRDPRRVLALAGIKVECDGSFLVLNRQAVQVFQREQRVHQAKVAVDVRHPQCQRRNVQRVRQRLRQIGLRRARAGFILRHADVRGLFGEANQCPQVLLRHPP